MTRATLAILRKDLLVERRTRDLGAQGAGVGGDLRAGERGRRDGARQRDDGGDARPSG